MFNLRQLQAFVSVAENRSFTQAARVMFMTQPAISAQIKNLEEKLGVQLLDRNEKAVSLTEAGELLYSEAKKILMIHEGLLESLDELKGMRRGRLALLASTIPGEYVLPGVIGLFARKYPEIEVSLNISDTKMVVHQLLERNADLGVIGAYLENKDLELEEYLQDELVIIRPSAEIPKRQDVSLADLTNESWVLREPGSGTRMVFETELVQAGINPARIRVIMELGSTRAIISAVECGLGLGIVSRWAAADSLRLGKVSEVPLGTGRIWRSLYLAWNKNKYRSFAARVFLPFLRDHRGSLQKTMD